MVHQLNHLMGRSGNAQVNQLKYWEYLNGNEGLKLLMLEQYSKKVNKDEDI